MAWSWSLAPDTQEHANALQLTDAERIILARMKYLTDRHGPQTIEEVSRYSRMGTFGPGQREAYLSLCRFGYIVAAEPRTVRHAAVADMLSPAGETRFNSIKARLYACCEHAVVIPCVCSESTYCPEPDHKSGCHGTHD
jgi:hypothetical protein